jgi:hypothetical protein
MTEQFQNPVEIKVEEKTATDLSAQKAIDQVADKAAAQSSKTENKFDKENSSLFSK